MPTTRQRSWCAKIAFLGSQADGSPFPPCMFGNVFAETELDAERRLKEMWAGTCPHEVTWITIVPGAIYFVEDKDGEREAA